MSRLDIVKEQIDLHWLAIGTLLDEQQALMGIPPDWDSDECRDASISLEEGVRDMSLFEFVGNQNFQWMMLDEIESMRTCDVCDTNPVDPTVQDTHGHAAREWRNGWLYMLCSCGREIGPFHNEDYAQDAFDLHASGRDDLIGY